MHERMRVRLFCFGLVWFVLLFAHIFFFFFVCVCVCVCAICDLQLYKIDPMTFSLWLDILKSTRNTVLWILRFPPAGEQNLRLRVAAAGLDPSRVIFSPVAGKVS